MQGLFGKIHDRPPAGKPGDRVKPWRDFARRDETGTIGEVRLSRDQSPRQCYLLYLYVVQFPDGVTKKYRAGDCTIVGSDQSAGTAGR